ncbi:MAG TPA: STAS domain-containing protein [Spirochaetia bacterium]|nr:STAS domain-containing protein [Spirochaetales bacterium]HRY78972.1 STAS domain-containing protein [Spirochaetia bacterium]HRZ90775.1 STAS domain-containing protein [Spirochaetia bacterium]
MGIETIGAALVLTPEIKHLDILSSKEFAERFAPAAKDARTVILDLSQVEFVDSSGLGALLNLVRDTLGRGGRISICRPQPSVKVLFRMVQLSKLVSIFDGKDAALAWAET